MVATVWPLGGLLASVLSRQEITEAEIEKLKEGDMLEATFTEFAESSSAMYQPLISERDSYMVAKLEQATASGDFKRVLVVIGAGHLKGLRGLLERGDGDPGGTIQSLDAVPAPSRWRRVVPWVIVALILFGFVVGFARSPELGVQILADWFFINGGLAALGAIIALAHPLTIVGVFVAAPLTSLNPLIGAGFVAAGIELWLRKPNVGDFERLRSDVTSARGWWRNRVARTLLVFILATLGSVAGTYLAGFRIFGRLLS